MNEKITLPSLVALLSARTGDTKKLSEDFVKEFFSAVSELLANGEQIKIKDIGVFKTIAVEARKSVNVSTGEEYLIPSHRKVVFIPSKELAAEVNAPFEMFETVELADDVTEEELETESLAEAQEMQAPQEIQEAHSEYKEEEPVEEDGEELEPLYEVKDEDMDSCASLGTQNRAAQAEETKTAAEEKAEAVTEADNAAEEKDEAVTDADNAAEEKVEAVTEADTAAEEKAEAVTEADNAAEAAVEDLLKTEVQIVKERKRPRYRFLLGMACGMLLAIAIIAVYALVNADQWRMIAGHGDNASKEAVIPTEYETKESIPYGNPIDSSIVGEPAADESPATAVTEEKTVDEVPTQPSDKKVYDTITKTRYLTTMAKDHYGNYHLWPYIYMENSAFLGHPDRIRPGTKVVVPPLSKYGVDPNNPADIAKAKKKGQEIYNRYK